MVEKIDFVVTWVDGSDPLWQEKKSKYDGSVNTSKKSMNSVKAYREWGTFKYWFRGVEKFAPWVNKVYLVTDQQKPSWLDIDSDKLVLVDHTEIIRNDYLPVFSANPIESNIHRISGLSEHFVFFNDDVYLTAPVEPTDFFSEEGLPKYNTALSPIVPQPYGTAHFQVNDMEIVNSYFSKGEILKNGKFLSLKQGWKNIIKTFLYRNTKFICGFWENHLAHPLLKSTMELVWEKETAILEKTSASRFRNPSDTNVWLFKYWQIASGKYEIADPKLGNLFSLDDAGPDFWKLLNSRKYKIMCINDSLDVKDEEKVMVDFIRAMGQLFPEKSSFEL
ncbi:stealth family protein [Streptococcus oralis]|uniref:Receptor polysaccharide phosphotransferase wefC (Stealth protein wefC) n=1 Tax=Streptococcus oralis TaxID=1303 RepID=A0A139QYF9_STROR|nr:stealth family protein [Streptococcus oralis]KXU07599.1 Receptor polysaccharide phosphotransferase wefC (Stealth protein wefC) [Streptococcus oralis]